MNTANNSNLPTFLIAGASKAGTEWLKRCLDEHPDIFIPKGAGNYFDNRYDRSNEWYQSFFRQNNGESVLGEKTTTYIINPHVPERIYSCIPDVKLIFVLRNPIERAYSHYKMQLRASLISDDIESVLVPGKPLVDEGRYREQLSRFEHFFDWNQIKIMFYDDLTRAPETFLQEIYAFLGVETEFHPNLLYERFHVTKGRPKWPIFFNALVATTARIQRASPLARDFIEWARRRGYVNFIHRINKGPDFPRFTRAHRRRLAEYYRDDVVALSELLNRDLSHWLKVD